MPPDDQPAAPPPSPPIIDGCAALPDVVDLGGELDGGCDAYCDVWNKNDRGSADAYNAIDAFGFERAEAVVFLVDAASLSAGCSPEIPTANFGFAGAGGWFKFTLTAGAAPTAISIIDSFGTTVNHQPVYMELRDRVGLTAGGAPSGLCGTRAGRRAPRPRRSLRACQ